MAKVAAAHCNPKVKPQLKHNDRTNDNAATIHKELSHLNECNKSAAEVQAEINRLYAESRLRFEEYCANKNGLTKAGKAKGIQNFTKKERVFHEFIFEIDDKTTLKDCEQLADEIAKLTGFRPLQVALHRDEGHEDAKGEFKTHHHAHAVFYTLDENGLQLARREAALNPKNLSQIQTLAAETLKMKRGERRYERGEKQPKFFRDFRAYKLWKEKEKELEKKAQELEAQEAELKQTLARIEQRTKERLQQLEQEFKNRASWFWNILTLGAHSRRLAAEFQIAKRALLEQETESQRRIETTQDKLREQNEILFKLKSELTQAKKSILSLEKQTETQKNRLTNREVYLKANLSIEELQRAFPDLYQQKHAAEEKQRLQTATNAQMIASFSSRRKRNTDD